MTADTVSPRYVHDCSRCRFLGHHDRFDLYFCKSDIESTVIARGSSEGPDYSSGMCFSYGSIPELSVARQRAQAAGLVDYDLKGALHAMPTDALPVFKDELGAELRKSEVGQALIALATDLERGTALVRAYVANQTAAFQARFEDRDMETLEDWARTGVNNAYDWARRLGLPFASTTAYTQALYGA